MFSDYDRTRFTYRFNGGLFKPFLALLNANKNSDHVLVRLTKPPVSLIYKDKILQIENAADAPAVSQI